MTAILNYLIEANIALTLIMAFYLLFLRKETNFRLLRYFLLAGIMGSVIFPLIHFETSTTSSSPLSIGQVLPSYWLPEVVIGGESNGKIETSSFDFWTYAGAIYFAGLIYYCMTVLFQVADILRIRNSAEATYRLHNLRIVESTDDRPTFSFFNFIFIGNAQTLSETEKRHIIGHEGIHAQEWHSMDILLINMLKMVFWFNPVVNIYRKIFIQLHEFEADARAVDRSEVDKYCSLLARVALQSAGLKLANHFNNSLTVKRIEMMRTIKTNIQRWRLVAIALMLPLVFFFVACQDQVGDDIMEIANNSSHTMEIPEYVLARFDQLKKENPGKTFAVVELNETASSKLESLKKDYGLPKSIEVFKTVDGKIVEAGTKSETGERDLILLPETQKDGQRTLAIIEFSDETNKIAEEASGEDKIYTVVEEQPEFVGGYDAMMTFIRGNMRYPLEARQQGIEGTAYVSFVVGTDGAISDVKIIRGLSGSIDEEAKRVVEAFPNWKPGKQSGQAVKVRFVLPVKFNLNVGATEKK